MTLMKFTRPLLAVALLAGGLVAAVGAPASASTSQCTTAHTWEYSYMTITSPAAARSGAYDGYTPSCWLASGNNNAAVRQLQIDINTCYGPDAWSYGGVNTTGVRLSTDGSFGARTKAALIAVQRYESVSADGVYGPYTASAMAHPGYRPDLGRTWCVRFTQPILT
jgi:peptidoglycan hydrolase-like protein with peptidoglycan-binding domain